MVLWCYEEGRGQLRELRILSSALGPAHSATTARARNSQSSLATPGTSLDKACWSRHVRKTRAGNGPELPASSSHSAHARTPLMCPAHAPHSAMANYSNLYRCTAPYAHHRAPAALAATGSSACVGGGGGGRGGRGSAGLSTALGLRYVSR
jgi:hypothetical protein